MKLVVCSIFDQAVGAFMQPFFSRSNGEAIRSFSDAVGDSKTPFCSHPEHYNLFRVAYFDDATGVFELPPAPVLLGSAVEYVRPVG